MFTLFQFQFLLFFGKTFAPYSNTHSGWFVLTTSASFSQFLSSHTGYRNTPCLVGLNRSWRFIERVAFNMQKLVWVEATEWYQWPWSYLECWPSITNFHTIKDPPSEVVEVTSWSLLISHGYFPVDGCLTAGFRDFRLNYNIFNIQLEAGQSERFARWSFSGVKLLEIIVKEMNSSC